MTITSLPIRQIGPNPVRPRQSFSQARLLELAHSIREHGVLSPLLVNQTEAGYQLVSGERRLRAARLAGLEKVPCYVLVGLAPQEALLLNLTDNLSAEPLSTFDLAASLKLLLDRYRLPKEEVLYKTGLSKKHFDQLIKALKLPDAIKKAYLAGRLGTDQLLRLTEIRDPLEALEAAQNL